MPKTVDLAILLRIRLRDPARNERIPPDQGTVNLVDMMKPSPKWTLLLGAIFAVESTSAEAGDAGIYDFPYPMNRLGWADASGKLSIWVNGGWVVDLGNGETLPLRFHFSSMQDRVSEGILGVGWWVPLLESTVVQVREDCVRMTALGGQSIYLFDNSGGEESYISKNKSWRGGVSGERDFGVSGPEGWTYRFKGGKIVQAVSPQGTQVEWGYDTDGRVQSLFSDKQKLLSIAKNEQTGLPDSIVFEKGKYTVDFKYEKMPLFGGVGNDVRPIDVLPMASSISTKKEGHINEVFRSEPILWNGTEIEMSTRLKTTVDDTIEYTWNPITHRLTSAGDFTYKVDPGKDNVQQIIQEGLGKKESYTWDGVKYQEIRAIVYGNGREHVTVTEFNGTHGKNFLRPTCVKTGESEVVYHYDEDGRVLRRVSKDLISGNTKAVNFPNDGKAIWEENGKPFKEVSLTKDGVTMSFLDSGSRTSTYHFQSGRLIGITKN